MKRFLVPLIFVVLVLASWAAYQTVAPPEPPMASLMPQGALLYLEAKDFAGILHQWDGSAEKKAWTGSDSYEEFSRSRLLLRLQEAQGEFAIAAGAPPDMAFASGVAGKHSALALYDIGKLQFVYITRLESGRAMENALWQKRAQFEPRESAGSRFFVRTESKSGRVVAFAVVDDYLILGTREDLVAGTLSLYAGKKLARLSDEGWFVDALKEAKDPGDLRMVIHLSAVAKTPYFRSYWIQDNEEQMRQYASSVSDLYLSAGTYREERALLMSSAPEVGTGDPADDAQGVAELLRLAPVETSFYRAKATPTVEDCLALLEKKVLAPRSAGHAPESKTAPTVNLGSGTVGSDSSLDVRIDTAPSANVSDVNTDGALRDLIAHAKVRAALQLQRSDAKPDGVFIGLRSTVVLLGSTDWDEARVQAAVQRVVAPTLTVGNLGASWNHEGKDAASFSILSGLTPIAVAVRGKYLFVSNDAPTLALSLARISEPASAEPAVYAAGFDHARERQNFYRLTSLVDKPSRTNESAGATPQFFSQQIASFSKAFGDVKSLSIVTRRNGSVEKQTVRYEWVQ